MRLLTALTLLSLAALAGAQEIRIVPRGSEGFGLGSVYNSRFDPATVITFSGRVSGVTISPPEQGLGSVATLLVKTSTGGTAIVDLGPAWFLEGIGARFAIGDQVTITGSKLIVSGRGLILASQVVRGQQVVALRDLKGAPHWVARREVPAQVVVQPANPSEPVPVVVVRPAQTTSAISGKIAAFRPLQPGSNIVVALIDLGTAQVPVVLGPLWFLERQDVPLVVGDVVVVDTLSISGSPHRWALRFTRGNDLLVLRLPDGKAVWEVAR